MYQAALHLLETLHKSGFEAYLAGGCVRDMLLDKKAKDYDIVTNALPEQIEELFPHTVAIGKHFGVILVTHNKHHFEIATFRSDSGYSDGRRPDYVTFTSAEEDAKRRDFTINGLFYDPFKEKVLDFVSGQMDIKEKLIRFIGNPETRINEDALRILRAIRFKNRLGFRYHPDTYEALHKLAPSLDRISTERIRDELNMLLLDKNRANALRDLHEFGLLKMLLPEIEALRGVTQPFQYHKEGDVFEHTLSALESIGETDNLVLVWATLLHDSGKAETFKIAERIRFDGHAEHSATISQKVLNRLRFAKNFIDEVSFLVLHHMMWVSLRDMPDNRKSRWIRDRYFGNLLALFKADASGSVPLDLSLYHEIETIVKDIEQKYPDQPQALLDGNDLIKELHLKPGPKLGKILTQVFEAQLDHQIETREQALALAQKIATTLYE